jgi:hypothetical protein
LIFNILRNFTFYFSPHLAHGFAKKKSFFERFRIGTVKNEDF